MRDLHIQSDSMRFRTNLRRMGTLLAVEASKNLDYESIMVQTPLAMAPSKTLSAQPVLLTILRAGMPMLEGVQAVFDHAPTGMIGAYRSHVNNEPDFTIEMTYMAIPDLTGRTIFLIDTMLATGKSLVQTIKKLMQSNKPAKVVILVCIAAQAGLDYVLQELPDMDIYIGAVDPILNDHFYIVPGLGDAGDLAYGAKL